MIVLMCWVVRANEGCVDCCEFIELCLCHRLSSGRERGLRAAVLAAR